MSKRKFRADVSFKLEIEADNMETAVYLAKAAVPKHFNMSTFGANGSGNAIYGGMTAIETEQLPEKLA